MTKLDLYQVDSFASEIFSGNPAAVIFSSPLDDKLMQNIALENNLSETAFVVEKDNSFTIRFFSPLVEVDLCGHATLAAAHIYFSEIDKEADHINFISNRGELRVTRNSEFIFLDFPKDTFEPLEIDTKLIEMLGVTPLEAFKGKDDIMCIFNNESSIVNIDPNMQLLKNYPVRGLIASAPGRSVDFVSRCFFPSTGVDEDPVTGSAHTTLTPYWTSILNKEDLTAHQISLRGGLLNCREAGDRVIIGGRAVTYMKGAIFI